MAGITEQQFEPAPDEVLARFVLLEYAGRANNGEPLYAIRSHTGHASLEVAPARAGDEVESGPDNERPGGQSQQRGADASAPARSPSTGPEELASCSFVGEGEPAELVATTSEGLPSAPGPVELANRVWARARWAFNVDAQRFDFLRRQIKLVANLDVAAPTEIHRVLHGLAEWQLETLLDRVETFGAQMHRGDA